MSVVIAVHAECARPGRLRAAPSGEQVTAGRELFLHPWSNDRGVLALLGAHSAPNDLAKPSESTNPTESTTNTNQRRTNPTGYSLPLDLSLGNFVFRCEAVDFTGEALVSIVLNGNAQGMDVAPPSMASVSFLPCSMARPMNSG
jgi:hypothetical protein